MNRRWPIRCQSTDFKVFGYTRVAAAAAAEAVVLVVVVVAARSVTTATSAKKCLQSETILKNI